ncbi:MAG: transglycosylase SLT domain-containing protein [Halobacteriovoraceae bacterium]|jgi:hypothetical protein|nr:transglycosylase SLT domain-containing protein [Halobacteriovoraceae bacterium]MBT5093143.1 transglycosylase SLT domain-containing protein [Halobacteriovoraceae bacterium]
MGKTIKYLILLGFLTLSIGSASAKKLTRHDCLYKKNTICRKLVTLKKDMDHKVAYKLSNKFYKAAKKFKLNPDLLISIAFQESGFDPQIVRESTGLSLDEETLKYKEVSIGSDFCLMQINIQNIKKMKLDVDKLLNNPTYCLKAGATILSQIKKKYSEDEEFWWTRYNARHELKREIYYNHVSRHLDKLEEYNYDQNQRSMASE